MQTVRVYCSGTIPKGGLDEGRLIWTDEERSDLERAAQPLRVVFLRPDDSLPALDDVQAVFGRDMYQIKVADFVVVDARERRGIGVGVEIAASRFLGTPLIAVVPPRSHYRHDELHLRGVTVADYIHPHLATLCDAIALSFEAAGSLIRDAVRGNFRSKGVGALEDAMDAYVRRLLPTDAAMREVVGRLGEGGG